ncbi:uncharacterized protein BDZ83DRAFT_623259 [Colletotrichum acutatum]|uniref:Secreted protein n=1 Tax=Glomerella acutata TaxID=27357 RepID=A0AAD8UNH2_GLOAC|nr:uncharacterized protein BDZ83DRAFT_623259 [Colletotrichum acutatum]KAK1724314.1 hypothetical protein BDZ83DRAFT_623259 [Colletotrichum acutatum]
MRAFAPVCMASTLGLGCLLPIAMPSLLVRTRKSGGAVESSIVMVLNPVSRGSDFYGAVSNTDATTPHPTIYDISNSTASKELAKHPMHAPYRVTLASSGKVWSLIVRGRFRIHFPSPCEDVRRELSSTRQRNLSFSCFVNL